MPLNPLEIQQSLLEGASHLVIGITRAQGLSLLGDLDGGVFVPQQARHIEAGNARISVLFAGRSTEEMAQSFSVAKEVLASRGVEPTSIRLRSPDQLRRQLDRQLAVAAGLTSGLVAISLLVGGIGVMNIMFVAVAERTKEIGTCMAVGATPQDILKQFLIEAALVGAIGAAYGVGGGLAMAYFVTAFAPGLPLVAPSPLAVISAIGFAVFVGVTFGIAPASRAANLHPSEAMRTE
jgi:putative ABC transport system permease protein